MMIVCDTLGTTQQNANIYVLTEKQIGLIQSIKRCIWLYFWLLIFEGALRKWALPMFANPILLIRDPVTVWIYIQAFRAGLFPRNIFVQIGGLIAWASLLAGLLAAQGSLLVPIYGFRTNFLHLPLIFIMQKFLGAEDVRKFGYSILIVSIPMTILMAVQFVSPAGAWINSGSDESFKQIGTAGGHIRAPGTFSFISGPIYFYTIAAAFLLQGLFSGKTYPKWLTFAAAFSVSMAPLVSGSRTQVGNMGIVVVCAVFAGTVLQPRLILRTVQALCLGFVVSMVMLQLPIFQDGIAVLDSRFNEDAGGVKDGFVMRFLADVAITPAMIYEPPLLGNGLGSGTIVGSVLDAGTKSLVLGESEWGRIIGESGPVFGLLFIAYRLALLVWIFVCAIRKAKESNVLSFLIAAACWTVILNGNWGQGTTLGFAIFGGGLCLAALNENNLGGHLNAISEKKQTKQEKV